MATASLNQFKAVVSPAEASVSTSRNVSVSASIGAPVLTLFGYAPARTKVTLTGIGVSEETYADGSGYFRFDNVFLPTNGSNYPEICVQASNLSATTQPTCLPSLSAQILSYDIGPVILSPIITVGSGNFLQDTQVTLNGLTTPDTEVNIYMAEEAINIPSLIKNVFAYSIPVYQTMSDNGGRFQFNLPSGFPSKWRVFSSATVLGAASAKSNTLNFLVEPKAYSIITFLKWLLDLIGRYLIYFVIIVEIVIVILLLISIKKHEEKQRKILSNLP